MGAELEAWFTQYADPGNDGTREAVTGRGQLGLAGVRGKGADNFAQDWIYASQLKSSS